MSCGFTLKGSSRKRDVGVAERFHFLIQWVLKYCCDAQSARRRQRAVGRDTHTRSHAKITYIIFEQTTPMFLPSTAHATAPGRTPFQS